MEVLVLMENGNNKKKRINPIEKSRYSRSQDNIIKKTDQALSEKRGLSKSEYGMNFKSKSNNSRNVSKNKSYFVGKSNSVNKINQNKADRRREKLSSKSYVNTIIDKPSMKITFLGGLDEIGKNITAFECLNDMFILDCGLAFPDGDMLGVDLVLPDFSYIERNRDKIKGLVITHGHEDHIGAIPYLLKSDLNFPIYGTPLTIGLIGAKLKEHNLLNKANMNIIKPGQRITLGCMEIEFIHVNHSIPDAVGIAIHSPAGTIIHTGDFKIDCTPTQGKMIDLSRFAELGNRGDIL